MKKAPDFHKENAGATLGGVPSIIGFTAGAGKQLSLPTIAPPPFAPRWPSIHTLDFAALELFLAGEFLTVERFRQLTESTRLPAVVDRLKRLGWPVNVDTVPEPSRRNRQRHAGVWHLPKKYSAMLQGGAA